MRKREGGEEAMTAMREAREETSVLPVLRVSERGVTRADEGCVEWGRAEGVRDAGGEDG